MCAWPARCDCSTSWMISAFSRMQGYLMPRPPHPRSCFLKRKRFSVRSATASFKAIASRQILHLIGRCSRVNKSCQLVCCQPRRFPSTSHQYIEAAMPSRQQSSRCSPRRAALPARCGSSLQPSIAGVSDAECRFRTCSAGTLSGPDFCFILRVLAATMNQKSSFSNFPLFCLRSADREHADRE